MSKNMIAFHWWIDILMLKIIRDFIYFCFFFKLWPRLCECDQNNRDFINRGSKLLFTSTYTVTCNIIF